MPNPKSQPTAAVKVAQYSKRWGISTRTAYAWLAKGVALDSDEAVAAFYRGLTPLQQKRTCRGFRRKLLELRKGGSTGKPDADFKAFATEYDKGGMTDQNVLADLKRQMAFFLHLHRTASERSDAAGASEAMEQVKQLSGVIHDSELRAQKLGRDLGDLAPRSELENVARFIGYHLLRCSDAALRKLAKAIAERSPTLPPITEQEVWALGEPLLIAAVVFEPIEKAMHGTNSAAPPEWLWKALVQGRSEVIEE